MKPHARKHIALTIAALALLSVNVRFPTDASAQTARPADSASMVKPPSAPDASGARAGNPDNMPVKRPKTPPNGYRMLHDSPASDAIAK